MYPAGPSRQRYTVGETDNVHSRHESDRVTGASCGGQHTRQATRLTAAQRPVRVTQPGVRA